MPNQDVRADRHLFLVASEGIVRADHAARFPPARVLFLFNDDALAAKAEAELPAGAEVVRYDVREIGFPATAVGEADTIFLALRDDRRLLLVIRAMKACSRFCIFE